MMNLNTNICLKTEDDVVYAVKHFNRCIQQAAWNAIPPSNSSEIPIKCSAHIREKLSEKRKFCKQWQILDLLVKTQIKQNH